MTLEDDMRRVNESARELAHKIVEATKIRQIGEWLTSRIKDHHA